MRALAFGFVALVALGACGPAATAPPAGPTDAVPIPTRDPAAAVRAEALDGPFRLVLELADDTWQAGEPIEGRARLELREGAGGVDLVGSGGGLLAFDTVEVDGRRRMEAAWTADCAPFRLDPGAPLTAGLAKSGGYSAEDPDAAFYRAFFADPLFRLLEGRWEIAAVATFAVGECGGRVVTLRAPLTVTIEP